MLTCVQRLGRIKNELVSSMDPSRQADESGDNEEIGSVDESIRYLAMITATMTLLEV